jgi:hypothetical protein
VIFPLLYEIMLQTLILSIIWYRRDVAWYIFLEICLDMYTIY